MNTATLLPRQGRHLLQLGVALLLFTAFQGFAIPYFAVPMLGLSVHRLSALEAVLLLPMGLLWSRLRLGPASARTAFWLLAYSALAIVAAYMMAAAWGAGDSMIRLAAQTGHGSALQETAITIVAYSSAPTGIVAFVLILWGLRGASVGGDEVGA
jgi:hydroxylaminobenzene mutase